MNVELNLQCWRTGLSVPSNSSVKNQNIHPQKLPLFFFGEVCSYTILWLKREVKENMQLRIHPPNAELPKRKSPQQNVAWFLSGKEKYCSSWQSLFASRVFAASRNLLCRVWMCEWEGPRSQRKKEVRDVNSNKFQSASNGRNGQKLNCSGFRL